MKEIRKYLSRHIFSTVTVMLMFVIQGLCVIALITWGNEIISTGLEGYGYEAGAPEVLSVETYEKRMEELPEETRNFISEYYVLLDRAEMSSDEYTSYLNEYPVISSQNIMKKVWIGSREIQAKLNHNFGMTKDEMIYEYMNLDMDVYTNRSDYIETRFMKMFYAILLFAFSALMGGFLWARVSARIGHDQRLKIKEAKGLSRSLDLQQSLIKFGSRFYLTILIGLSMMLCLYYWNEWRSLSIVNNDYIMLGTIMVIGVMGSLYTNISAKGTLNRGFCLGVKVAVLAGITAVFGNEVGLFAIGTYGVTTVLITWIRYRIKKAQKTIVDAHSENIDNVEGQLTFVVDKEDIEVTSVEMKRMVRNYLNNNEYLFESSWLLEFWEVMDRSVVAIFNFAGLIAGMIAMCYLSANFGVDIYAMLPFLLLFTF